MLEVEVDVLEVLEDDVEVELVDELEELEAEEVEELELVDVEAEVPVGLMITGIAVEAITNAVHCPLM